MSFDIRIAELGLELPVPFTPAGAYLNSVLTGSLLVLAGHIPIAADGRIVVGKLGAELGTLDLVRRIVSLRGLVNATPDFTRHTQVIDAASGLLVDIFGDTGRHARVAFGVRSLPANLTLEIELLAEVA